MDKNIKEWEGKKLLTRSEVEELNSGEVPFMSYYKGKLEWVEGWDYWLVYGTGSFVWIDKKV
jgi:hypothetical protein